jgi:hypothetical protein
MGRQSRLTGELDRLTIATVYDGDGYPATMTIKFPITPAAGRTTANYCWPGKITSSLLLWAALSQCVTAQPKAGGEACTAPTVPTYALNYLKQHYPAWRITQLSDLNPYQGEQQWLLFTHRRCPGLAAGKFQPGPELTYAFLLIPATKAVTGFRLVTVTRDARGAIQAQVVASDRPEDGGWGGNDRFIRTAHLATFYEDVHWSTETGEGILVGGDASGTYNIIYWNSGKYVVTFADGANFDQ